MNKYYISFGQGHHHNLNGVILDKDCLLELTMEKEAQARAFAWKMFGAKWSFIYTKLPNMIYFPRGTVKL